MQFKKVVVDTYGVDNGGTVSVRGRYNHVSSTEVDIQREVNITFDRDFEEQQAYADGFELVSEPLYGRVWDKDINVSPINTVHLAVKTKKSALNRSIKSLKYKPSGCHNEYECFPKEQAIVLPYLCDRVSRENMVFAQPNSDFIFIDNDVQKFWYDPSCFGDIFISTYANGNSIQHADRYGLRGRTARHLVVFEGEVDGLIPCTFNTATDTITCAPVTVTIHDSVFGKIAGENVVFTLDGPLIELYFDDKGIAKLSGADRYVVNANLETELIAVDITDAFDPAVGAVAVVNGENAEIMLWLRRPDFRKGAIVNRDLTPHFRLVEWYNKQDQSSDVAFDNVQSFPTNIQLYHRFFPKRKGTHVPDPVYKQPKLGTFHVVLEEGTSAPPQGEANYAYVNDYRTLDYMALMLDDVEVRNAIHNAANGGEQIAVILRSTADLWPTLPFPTLAEQYEGEDLDEAKDLVLLFTPEQCEFGVDYIILRRGFLRNQGGAGNWGGGRPFFCPFDQLTGLRDEQGVLHTDNNLDEISTGVLLPPLEAKGSIVTPMNNNGFGFDANDNISEINDTFRDGTKALFHRNRDVQNFPNDLDRYWVHDVKLRRWLKIQSQLTYDLDTVLGAPAPGAIIQANIWALYGNNNLQPLPDNNKQLSTVVYELYDSTETRFPLQPDVPIVSEIFQTGYDLRLVSTKVRFVDDYLQTLNHVERAAEKAIQDEEDTLLKRISEGFQGDVLTISPGFLENVGVNVVRPTVYRNTANIQLREKLFAYKTANFLAPFKIYQQFGEFYPLQLQDYTLRFEMSSDFSQLISHYQSRDIINTAETRIKNIKGGETIIYVRSRDSANQEDKELERIAYLYPEIERFTKRTPYDQDIVVKCLCGSPIPDYFFIYIERVAGSNVYDTFENEPPKVKTIYIKRNGQQIRIYNQTQLSKFDLVDMTRRNSHPRADMKQLYEEFGGVLISKYDLGTLLDEQVTTYLLDLEFSIELELEPNNEPVARTEPGLIVYLEDQFNDNDALQTHWDGVQDEADTRYIARTHLDTQTTVLFLYENGSRLEGDALKMEFKKTTI